tara:strand:- start:3611 stop:5431 length:1821 start_codon:yes stop_codon:yes gene_type:complete
MNKYTPASIDKSFVIPLYQRLFEWEESEISQLLLDLHSSFKKDSTTPYYIGMLTVHQGDSSPHYSLVDGQQRFTVITLMAITFGWEEFLKIDESAYRLSFFAREDDENYLKRKIGKVELNSTLHYVNHKMEEGINCIEKFIQGIDLSEVDLFKEYIKNNITFFISELPHNYSAQDLNRYFEAMNEAGKGLENHEILKVQMLRKVEDSKKADYTKIWNVVSEMDKRIIRQNEKELLNDFRKRNEEAFKNQTNINELIKPKDNNTEKKKESILDIKANSSKPSEKYFQRGEKSILGFSEFLLQVLWISIEDRKSITVTDFFNKYKLLETFENYLLKDGSLVEINTFFNNLLKFRLYFDYFIIRLNGADNFNSNYSLLQVDIDDGNVLKQKIINYQSMLYVSTKSHLWITPVLEEIDKSYEIMISDFLSFLKFWDNKRHNNRGLSLKYGEINRYWFWRLDYYLWENREEYFDADSKKIADNYIFRSNRSIEHIAPQTPKRESKVKLEREFLDSFGNLAMISSGQNSSLKNESFEVKKAHVSSFVNNSVGGSIESLKLLQVHKYDSWDEEKLREHHNNMIEVLIKSFDSSKDFLAIIEKLNEQKIQLINA